MELPEDDGVELDEEPPVEPEEPPLMPEDELLGEVVDEEPLLVPEDELLGAVVDDEPLLEPLCPASYSWRESLPSWSVSSLSNCDELLELLLPEELDDGVDELLDDGVEELPALLLVDGEVVLLDDGVAELPELELDLSPAAKLDAANAAMIAAARNFNFMRPPSWNGGQPHARSVRNVME